ncbi:MAG: hypothetical protein VXZ82_19885 [Planctomycetota bacterium]|nr:hypothetical protein [Planctomycetota bacterium]
MLRSILSLPCLPFLSICLSSLCAGPGFSGEPDEKAKQNSSAESGSGNASAPREKKEPRRAVVITRELVELEKQTNKLKSDVDKGENIIRICELFVEVGEHPSISTNGAFQSLNMRIRNRLRGIERRLVKEMKQRKIPEPPEMVARREEENKRRAAGNSAAYGSASNGSAGQGNSALGGFHRNSPSGENAAGNSPGANAAPGPDYGWYLVNLIRTVIKPEYWSVAGGPGKAIYFPNSRALIIHGSWRIQEDVADLLTALRGG